MKHTKTKPNTNAEYGRLSVAVPSAIVLRMSEFARANAVKNYKCWEWAAEAWLEKQQNCRLGFVPKE